MIFDYDMNMSEIINEILERFGFDETTSTIKLEKNTAISILKDVLKKRDKPRHSAYSLFMKEQFEEIRKNNMVFSTGERMKYIGTLWRNRDKKKYCAGSDWYNNAIKKVESNAKATPAELLAQFEIEEEEPVTVAPIPHKKSVKFNNKPDISILKKEEEIDRYILFCWENREELEQYTEEEKDMYAREHWEKLKDDDQFKVGSDWYNTQLEDYLNYH